jgi:hypothetical protein
VLDQLLDIGLEVGIVCGDKGAMDLVAGGGTVSGKFSDLSAKP